MRPAQGLVRPAGLLALAALTLPLAGCAGLAQKLADRALRRHEHSLHLIEGDAARFRQCLKHRGGSCPQGASSLPHADVAPPGPARASISATGMATMQGMDPGHPARMGAAALACPALDGATQLYSHLRGLDTAPSDQMRSTRADNGRDLDLQMTMSMSDLQRCHDQVLRAHSAGAWDALEEHLGQQVDQASAGSRQHGDLRHDHRRAAFVRTYVSAYFSNGHFLSVDLQVDKDEAIDKLKGGLARHPTLCTAFNAAEAVAAGKDPTGDGADCTALAESIYRGVLGKTLGSGKPLYLVRAKPTGFLPRDGGAKLQFPEIDVDLDPVQRPIVQLTYGGPGGSDRFDTAFWLPVGQDLIRVLLEAVFDAHEGLPTATSEATGTRVPRYPLQDVADLKDAQNLQENLDRMRDIDQRVAAGVGVILDRLIRGVGPISLNNEALEQLIVTVVATSVKKAMEKASWCYFACDLNTALEAAKRDVEGDIRDEEHRLAHYAHERTEKVRLHLRLHP